MSLHIGGSAGNDDRHHHTATSLPPHPHHHSSTSYPYSNTHPLPSSHPYPYPYSHPPAEHPGYVDYRVAQGLSSASAVPGVAGLNSSPAVPLRSTSQALGAHGAHVSHIHAPTSTQSPYTPHHGSSAAQHMPSPLSNIPPGLRDPPTAPAAPTASSSPSEASLPICFNCGASGHYLRTCTQPRLPKNLLRNVRRAMEASDRRSTAGARTDVPTAPHPPTNTSTSPLNTASSSTLCSQARQRGDRNPEPKQPHSSSTVPGIRQPCSTPSLNGLFMVELKDGIVVGTPKRIVTRSLSRNVQRASKKAVNTGLQPASPPHKSTSQPRTNMQSASAPPLAHTPASTSTQPSPLSRVRSSSSTSRPTDGTVRAQSSTHNLAPNGDNSSTNPVPPAPGLVQTSLGNWVGPPWKPEWERRADALRSLPTAVPTAQKTTSTDRNTSTSTPSSTTNQAIILPPLTAASTNERPLHPNASTTSVPPPTVVLTKPVPVPSTNSFPSTYSIPQPVPTVPPTSQPYSHHPITARPIASPSSTNLPSSAYSYHYDSSTNSWLYYHPTHGYISVPHSAQSTLR